MHNPIDLLSFVALPEYEISESVVKAEAGKSAHFKFTVKSDEHSGTIDKHTLKKKDSDEVKGECKGFETEIALENVVPEDQGTYIIACQNNAGTGTGMFELEVIS